MNESHLIRYIQTNWNLSVVSLELLQYKGDRYVYKITAQEGTFVIKVSNTAKSYEDMVRDTFIFDYAPRHGFTHIPKLLKTNDGKSFAAYNDTFASIMEYIGGGSPESTPSTWAKLGTLTAEFHNIEGYPYETDFTPEGEQKNFQEIAATLSFGKEYLNLAESLPDFSKCSHSLIHTDIGPHNSAQNKQGDLFFLDWDGVGVGITILDLGFPLICQFLSFDHVFDEESARAFYQSYFYKRNLSDYDKSLIFDAALLFALMYLPYHDQGAWERIGFAVRERDVLEKVILNR